MTEPNWLTIARGEIGQRQWPGSWDNPRVLEYLAACNFHPEHDEGMEWCGAFLSWVIQGVGLAIGEGNKMISAYPPWWRGFGTALASPQIGAIAIKKSGLHVAFVESVSGIRVNLLGGNQDDAVKIWTGKLSSDFTYRMPG